MIEKIKKIYNNKFSQICMIVFVIFVGLIISSISLCDYGAIGILMILTFYYTRQKKWYNYIIQVLCLYIINNVLAGGYYYPIQIGEFYFELQRQTIAVLSLVFIWLYNGQKGYSSKWFKNFCYIFYPAHAFILFLLAKFIF